MGSGTPPESPLSLFKIYVCFLFTYAMCVSIGRGQKSVSCPLDLELQLPAERGGIEPRSSAMTVPLTTEPSLPAHLTLLTCIWLTLGKDAAL